jgi:predicted small secreted protein
MRSRAGTRRAFVARRQRVPRCSTFDLTAKGLDMKKATAALITAALMMLAGCNTIEGAGKDVKATGSAVERAADKAKPY